MNVRIEEGYLHPASGVTLSREIAQPHVERFGDVFTDWEPWPSNGKPSISPRSISGEGMGSKPGEWGEYQMAVGPYCMWQDRYDESKAVRCADWVLSRLKEKTVIIQYDSIDFQLIDHDNGWTLVVASHNQIIGSVWLAYIRTDSIPTDRKAGAL